MPLCPLAINKKELTAKTGPTQKAAMIPMRRMPINNQPGSRARPLSWPAHRLMWKRGVNIAPPLPAFGPLYLPLSLSSTLLVYVLSCCRCDFHTKALKRLLNYVLMCSSSGGKRQSDATSTTVTAPPARPRPQLLDRPQHKSPNRIWCANEPQCSPTRPEAKPKPELDQTRSPHPQSHLHSHLHPHRWRHWLRLVQLPLAAYLSAKKKIPFKSVTMLLTIALRCCLSLTHHSATVGGVARRLTPG